MDDFLALVEPFDWTRTLARLLLEHELLPRLPLEGKLRVFVPLLTETEPYFGQRGWRLYGDQEGTVLHAECLAQGGAPRAMQWLELSRAMWPHAQMMQHHKGPAWRVLDLWDPLVARWELDTARDEAYAHLTPVGDIDDLVDVYAPPFVRRHTTYEDSHTWVSHTAAGSYLLRASYEPQTATWVRWGPIERRPPLPTFSL